MKVLINLVLIMALSAPLMAQTWEGDVYVGLNGNGAYFNNSHLKQVALELTPTAGRFTSNNVALTGSLLLAMYSTDIRGFKNSGFSAGGLVGVKPFAPLGENFFITPFLNTGYRFTVLRPRKEQAGQILLQVGIGAAWFLNYNTALTIEVPYTYQAAFNHQESSFGDLSLKAGFIISLFAAPQD